MLSLTLATLSFAKPRYIIEVEDKKGDGERDEEEGRLAEDKGDHDQDEVAVGGRDARDYRMVIILLCLSFSSNACYRDIDRVIDSSNRV